MNTATNDVEPGGSSVEDSRRRSRCVALATTGCVVLFLAAGFGRERYLASENARRLVGLWEIRELDRHPAGIPEANLYNGFEFEDQGRVSMNFFLGSPMSTSSPSWSTTSGKLRIPISLRYSGSSRSTKGWKRLVSLARRLVGRTDGIVAVYAIRWESDDVCHLEKVGKYSFGTSHRYVKLVRSVASAPATSK